MGLSVHVTKCKLVSKKFELQLLLFGRALCFLLRLVEAFLNGLLYSLKLFPWPAVYFAEITGYVSQHLTPLCSYADNAHMTCGLHKCLCKDSRDLPTFLCAPYC